MYLDIFIHLFTLKNLLEISRSQFFCNQKTLTFLAVSSRNLHNCLPQENEKKGLMLLSYMLVKINISENCISENGGRDYEDKRTGLRAEEGGWKQNGKVALRHS